MALVVNDRVKETSTTTGTGTFDLAGAATGFQTFVAGVGDTNTTYYAIFNQGTTEWEVGLGTVTDAATDTLARTTILESSNSDAAVDFGAGTKDVFCTLPASRVIYGKTGGTDFTGSMIVGHSTTGTLNDSKFNIGIGSGSGYAPLENITSGDSNVAVGQGAGNDITSGGTNTFIGRGAGDLCSTSNENTAIGANALGGLTTSSNGKNTAIGANSMIASNGGWNSCLGRDAGRGLTSGNYNICIGYDGGDNIQDGDGNIIIGTGDAAATDSARTFKVISYDGSSTTNHIISDSSGNMIFAGTANAAGGQLTTTGKAFVMGF